MGKRVVMQTVEVDKLFFDVGKERLFTEGGTKTERFALVRKDSGDILGYCSDDYKIVPNKDVISEVTEVLSKEQYALKKCLMEKSGARCYVEYESPINFDVPNSFQRNDIVKARIVFYNSFNAQRCLGLLVGIFRLVCSNGAYRADNELSFEYRHMNGLFEGKNENLIDKSKQAIHLLSDKYIPAWQAMATRKIEMSRIEKLVKLMPGRLMEEVNGSNELLGKTEWEGYNDFTYQLTHQFNGSFSRNLDIQKNLVKAFDLN